MPTAKELAEREGFRTLGTVTRTTVFETVPFDHSGTSPRAHVACRLADGNRKGPEAARKQQEIGSRAGVSRELTYILRLLYCAAQGYTRLGSRA